MGVDLRKPNSIHGLPALRTILDAFVAIRDGY